MTKKEILSAISSKLKITALNNMQKEQRHWQMN